MPMTYKNSLISFILIIFVAIAAWMTLPDNNRRPLAPIEPANSLPDAWMEEVHTVIMDKQGKPKIKIVSSKITHYTEDDTSLLASPKLTLYRPSLTPWYVTANQGKATHGIDKVDFWQNVVIHHPGDSHQPATLIETTTLMVQPKQQSAETKDNITMRQPNLTIKAMGMHASMITGDIQLLSKARGEYVPHS